MSLMQFESPWILLGLIAIPFLFRYWYRKGRPPRIAFPISIPDQAKKWNPLYFLLTLKCLGLAALIIALARPQVGDTTQRRNVSGVDIVLVMDVSDSMNIEDLGDRARLEIAKDTIRSFIRARNNDRIGYVIFSGEPLTLAPPTLDYGLVLQSVSETITGILKDGTAIGDGLSLAVSRLKGSRAKSKVIILLTDGENNVGQIDPNTAGKLAAGYGIKVYTIAIGKEGRVKLPRKRKGLFGNVVTSYQWFENQLNPELLIKIAEETNGKFYRVTEAGTLEAVFSEIDKLEKTEIKAQERVQYKDVFGIPLQLGILFLLLEKALALGWWRIFA